MQTLDTLIRGTRKALSKELQYYHVSLEWSGPIKKPRRREEKKELHVYETLEEGVAQWKVTALLPFTPLSIPRFGEKKESLVKD